MEDMEVLRQRMKERREALGLSIRKVAISLGVAPATYMRIESGETKRVSNFLINAIADILKCDTAYLWGLIDTPRKEVVKLDNQEQVDELDELLLIGKYRQLRPVQKETVQNLLDYMIDKGGDE